MKLIREYIRRLLFESYQSHTFEPIIGDSIQNINPGCVHFKSQGVVLDIDDVPDGAGKLIVYKVTNNGPTYQPGDELEKTLDQLAPL